MAADHLSEKMKNVIWPEFRAHFRSAASAASYWSDLCEFAQITGTDLRRAREQDVQAYYRIMTERCEGGEIQQGTLAKKFRELHSLADFMCRRTGRIRAAFLVPGLILTRICPVWPARTDTRMWRRWRRLTGCLKRRRATARHTRSSRSSTGGPFLHRDLCPEAGGYRAV